MKRNTSSILAIAVLALAALACKAVTGEYFNTATPEIPTLAPGPSVIMDDDFSSTHWGTRTDADSSVEYAGNALQFIIYRKNFFAWSTPNDRSYQDVHLEVTVLNHNTHPTTAFGFICNKKSRDDYYYLVITPAGEYAIAKASAAQSDIFLTNNDHWARSDFITGNASSYRVGADCGHGILALYVDGQLIDSVSDASYSSGQIALFAWSGEEQDRATVSFDDFRLTELPGSGMD
jgi:hypothetical protein